MKEGFRLYINITNKCNTNCPFCCMFSSTKNDKHMDFETYKKLIDEIEGPIEVQLEGGEPLIHKDLYLFIEYALSKPNTRKILILTNGLKIDKHLKRLVEICKWYDVEFEIKISVNYWLLEQDKKHIEKIKQYIFATEYIEKFKITLNVRKRKEGDEWIIKEIEDCDLLIYTNSYYFQSYGKLTNSKYDKPVIKQNIEDWAVYAVDGKCFGQDLIARSEYEGELVL